MDVNPATPENGNKSQPVQAPGNSQESPRPEKNTAGTAGFIVSLVAIIFGGFGSLALATILRLLGLFLSILGLSERPRGLAIAGLVLSLINILCTAFAMLQMAS